MSQSNLEKLKQEESKRPSADDNNLEKYQGPTINFLGVKQDESDKKDGKSKRLNESRPSVLSGTGLPNNIHVVKDTQS